MSIFEVVMLLCFGASWPFSLYKVYKTRNVTGISIKFLALVLIGYICGIIHKFLFSFDVVILLYIFNSTLVAAEIYLYMLYKPLSQAKVPVRYALNPRNKAEKEYKVTSKV